MNENKISCKKTKRWQPQQYKYIYMKTVDTCEK